MDEARRRQEFEGYAATCNISYRDPMGSRGKPSEQSVFSDKVVWEVIFEWFTRLDTASVIGIVFLIDLAME